jgi:hypothetical protein
MKAPNGMWMITVGTQTGPWHVASASFSGSGSVGYWYIVNMLTGDAVRTGKVRMKGTNYCDRAREEARSRNNIFFKEHEKDLPTFMGINPEFDKVIGLVLQNTPGTLTAQEIFDKARGF